MKQFFRKFLRKLTVDEIMLAEIEDNKREIYAEEKNLAHTQAKLDYYFKRNLHLAKTLKLGEATPTPGVRGTRAGAVQPVIPGATPNK